MERTPGTGWGDGKDRPPNRLHRPYGWLTACARRPRADSVSGSREVPDPGPARGSRRRPRGAGARRQAARRARAAAPACQPARRRGPDRAGAVGRGRARRRGCHGAGPHLAAAQGARRWRRAGDHGGRLRAAGRAGELDADRLAAGVAAGRAELAAGRFEAAAAALETALAEWRGPPLADLADAAFADLERARLEELRVAALEELRRARAGAGRHAEMVGELDALVAEHPYRERLRAQRMLALYRCDRQADALAGLPGRAPRAGRRARHRAGRAAARAGAGDARAGPGARGRPPATARRAGRRRSSGARHAGAPGAPAGEHVSAPASRAAAAGPRGVHDALALYAPRGGGRAPRRQRRGLSGDLVVGVFGLASCTRTTRCGPCARRASCDDEQPRRELASSPARNSSAAGTAAGEAARCSRGPPSSRPQPAAGRHRARRARARALLRDAEAAAPRSPFVDRERELGELREAFAAARDERACRLVTRGRARRDRQVAARARARRRRRRRATVVVGRCVSYGDGITYGRWRRSCASSAGRRASPSCWPTTGGGAARARRDRRVRGARPGRGDLLGASGGCSRRRRASGRSSSSVEDVHWAEPTLLDLARLPRRVLARACRSCSSASRGPSCWRRGPAWAAPQAGRSVHVLQPLGAGGPRAELVSAPAPTAQTGADRRDRRGQPAVPRAARGGRARPGEALPPTIQAVLAARLERLEPGERAVLAARVGRGTHVPRRGAARAAARGDRAGCRSLVAARAQAADPGRALAAARAGRVPLRATRWCARRRTRGCRSSCAWSCTSGSGAGSTSAPGLPRRSSPTTSAGAPAARRPRHRGARARRGGRAARERRPRPRCPAATPAGAALLERAASLQAATAAAAAAGRRAVRGGPRRGRRARAGAGGRPATSRGSALARCRAASSSGSKRTRPRQAAYAAPSAGLDDERGQSRAGCCGAGSPGSPVGWPRRTKPGTGRPGPEAGLHRDLFEILGWQAAAAALGPMPAEAAIRVSRDPQARGGEPGRTAAVLNPLATCTR